MIHKNVFVKKPFDFRFNCQQSVYSQPYFRNFFALNNKNNFCDLTKSSYYVNHGVLLSK